MEWAWVRAKVGGGDSRGHVGLGGLLGGTLLSVGFCFLTVSISCGWQVQVLSSPVPGSPFRKHSPKLGKGNLLQAIRGALLHTNYPNMQSPEADISPQKRSVGRSGFLPR